MEPLLTCGPRLVAVVETWLDVWSGCVDVPMNVELMGGAESCKLRYCFYRSDE
jgi:hypothetical protein